MACFDPWIAQRTLDEEDKTPRFIGKAKKILTNDKDHALRSLKEGVYFTIPCGKCLGCRLDYARRWADRMILEYQTTGKGLFITLTYDEDHLPDPVGIQNDGRPIAPLVKSDLSGFIKRLRSYISDKGYDDKIRFFGCGEYGEKGHRPHYHVILFGIDMDFLENFSHSEIRGNNELGQPYYQNLMIQKRWSKGITQVSPASYLTMGYVARYTVKKALGNNWAIEQNIEPEFTLMSRRPGIGVPFLEDHLDEVRNNSRFKLKDAMIYWPKILVQEALSESEYEIMKEAKAQLVLNKVVNKFELDSRPAEQILENDEYLMKQRIKKLRRGDVNDG